MNALGDIMSNEDTVANYTGVLFVSVMIMTFARAPLFLLSYVRSHYEYTMGVRKLVNVIFYVICIRQIKGFLTMFLVNNHKNEEYTSDHNDDIKNKTIQE